MAGKGRIENLRPPWKPGESGNPSGRPKRVYISEIYADLLVTPLPEEIRRKLKRSEGITFAEALALSVLENAVSGSLAAVREVREATEGKTSERSKEISGPVRFRHVYEQLESKNVPGVTSKTEPGDGS